ncbi:MAG: hypothetical protein R3324_14660, partial [Halobacteriales archaeon]|nr:hypothetical protein [Halobacteriales archaeon]
MPAISHVALPFTGPEVANSLDGNLVILGDSFAIGHLADAGYDPASRALSWLDNLTLDGLRQRIEAGGRIVLTDTNQRRRWDIRGVGRAYTPVLSAEQTLDATETRARTLDPATQTSAFFEGGVGITSSEDRPGLFRAGVDDPPSFAADGDPNTSWVTGAFGTAAGAWIRLNYDEELPLADVRIVVDTDRDRVPSRLRVRAEDEDFVVDVPQDGEVRVGRFSNSRWLRIDVLRVRGEGPGPIGLTDISVAGRTIRAGLSLPTLAPSADVRRVMADAPFDIVFTRMQGDPSSELDDEERNLLRQFTIPDPRDFSVEAVVRPTNPPESLLDAVALDGFDGTIVSPTSTELGALGRASQAFDGDPDTAWRPVGPTG